MNKPMINKKQVFWNVYARVSFLSREACEEHTPGGPIAEEESLLTTAIDGMDQSKFKIPRNLSSSKEFDSHWRPQLHVVGALAHGVCEAYYLADADLPKNASTNCDVIARTIDHVDQILFCRQKPMPKHLWIQASYIGIHRSCQISVYPYVRFLGTCRYS